MSIATVRSMQSMVGRDEVDGWDDMVGGEEGEALDVGRAEIDGETVGKGE